MILPGTQYRIIHKINSLSPIGSIGMHFSISLDTDPRTEKVRVESKVFNEKQYLDKNDLEANCELVTDFGEAIYFYIPQDEYGMFSNFSEHGITVNGLFYPTLEHYYQASKFKNVAYHERIRKCGSPKRASELGKSKNEIIRGNWDDLKIEIMTEAIRLKFDQHTEIRNILASTEDRLLIENSPYGNFWGIGRTGEGLNYLGTILMRIRMNIKTT